jgi:hypothetical protein
VHCRRFEVADEGAMVGAVEQLMNLGEIRLFLQVYGASITHAAFSNQILSSRSKFSLT